ncbi:phosphocholine cytidylyltransferase family protein [Pseudodesulfovibrio sp.]|uniref:phosphocholine cytidylyltransferase family protein n=1 Tax=unclassified Pseudodesulfovibrio TaxID=2661612 RepID=UPI003B00E79B
MSTTRAIILAAGRGSRMHSLTQDRPKCLVELGGRPLLEWQLNALRVGGISDILVVTGYMGHKLSGNFKTLENPDWATSNMVTTLTKANQWLREGPTLIAYSDILYRPEHVRALACADGDLAMTYDTLWRELWGLRFEDPLSDAETFRQEGGILREIGAHTDSYADIQGQYMGLLKCTPAGWERVHGILSGLGSEGVAGLDVTALFKMLLSHGVAIQTIPVKGGWCEADSGDDLAQYEEKLKEADAGLAWSHDFRVGYGG